MKSREKILSAVLSNQPTAIPLPEVDRGQIANKNNLDAFISILERIGGQVIQIPGWPSIVDHVKQNFQPASRILSLIPDLPWHFSPQLQTPQSYENVDLAILKGHFGVAENGAIWITDKLMGDRSIPFISQHLSLVIHKKDIVPTLHEAYNLIESTDYEFGTFIAGPSKTADIEQSLVLGAHGPKSLIVFILPD